MQKDNGINLFNIIIKFIMGMFTTIAMISISTVITLNSTPIYKIIIERYDLTIKTGLTKGQLVENYKILVNYLQNPFVEKLKLEDFVMSANGEIHFFEVKDIFIKLIVISFVFVLSILIYFVLHKVRKVKKIDILEILNYSSNILIIFFVILITTFFINFSWIFEMFHKIFFKNDYWIFDPKTDPIITALPEELFMIFAIIILSILIISAIIIKILYYKKKG